MHNDIRKNIWRNAFIELDEEGEIIEQPRKILSDGKVSRARANRLKAKNNNFRSNCSAGQAQTWNSEKGLKRRKKLELTWQENPEKLINGRKKRINTPWGIYDSRKEAIMSAKDKGISNPTTKITQGLKINGSEYYYLYKKKKTISQEAIDRMKETIQKNGSKKWVKIESPFGIFPNKKITIEAMKQNNVPNAAKSLEKFLKDPNSGYKKI